MGVINFSKANCKNCYSCVRACPVKAVRVKNEQAEIIEERCIVCGKCLKVCPKNAKEIESELKTIKEFLVDDYEVVVSIAPSFVAAYGNLSNKICAALKELGFDYVEETIIGAKIITDKYMEYACKTDKKAYITSCCPSVNGFIEKYYPQLIENLIPVISPMQCHGKLIKKKYGTKTRVVFIGPCLAKKSEAKEEYNVDAVLTFEELSRWFNDSKIKLDNLKEIPFDTTMETMKRYPIVGGVTHTLKNKNINRKIIQVDGVEDCHDILKAIKDGKFHDALIEMSLCRHGCINGPAMPENEITIHERRQWVEKYAMNCEKSNKNTFDSNLEVNTDKIFQSRFVPLKQPTEEVIKEILMGIGKYTKQDELNCGTCGYETCKDKAIAVYNGLAEPTMCLPFMKQKAETLSNVIFDMTPSIIVIINTSLEIIDFNPAAERFFRVKKNMALGIHISMLLEADIFNEVKESKSNIFARKATLPYEDAIVLQSAIWVEHHQAILLIIHDISESIRQEERLKLMKINTIEMAQQVIDKQMRVAQEIASLLGETTAETKVSLTKLKRLVQEEEV